MQKLSPTAIFLHVPKAAGTTLQRIIERQYPRQQIYTTHTTEFHTPQGMAAFGRLYDQHPGQLRLIKGHMPFGLHTHLSRPSTYFTVLRDPIERILSQYYFILLAMVIQSAPSIYSSRSLL